MSSKEEMENLADALGDMVSAGKVTGLMVIALTKDDQTAQYVLGNVTDKLVYSIGAVEVLKRDLLSQADGVKKGGL